MSTHINQDDDKSLNKIICLFFAFSLISIADATSSAIGSGNIRLAWALLPFLILLLPKSNDDIGSLAFVFVFFALHIISAAYNNTIISGGIFSSWILVNYFFFFRSAYIITKIIGDRIWDTLLILGRLQIIAGCILYFLGVHERTQFTYYEPSYFAIGIVPYIFCTVFWSKKKTLDLSLITLLLITSQSANMMIAVFLAAASYLLFSRKFAIIIAAAAIFPTVIYASYLTILQNPENPNYGIANWINQNGIGLDLVFEALRRAGNRVPRIEAALEVLNVNWWLVIGPGNYTGLTANMNFDHLTDGIIYYDPSGLPAINIIIESALNSGIGGAIIILSYAVYIFYRARTADNLNERWLMLGSLFAFFLMLQIESSYLRAYIWFALGIFTARTPPSNLFCIDLKPEPSPEK